MNATMATDISVRGCDDIEIRSLARKPQEGELAAPEAKWIHAVAAGGGGGGAPPLQIDDSEPNVLLFSGIGPNYT